MTWNHKPYWLCDTFIASTYSSPHLSQQAMFWEFMTYQKVFMVQIWM